MKQRETRDRLQWLSRRLGHLLLAWRRAFFWADAAATNAHL